MYYVAVHIGATWRIRWIDLCTGFGAASRSPIAAKIGALTVGNEGYRASAIGRSGAVYRSIQAVFRDDTANAVHDVLPVYIG